MDPNATPEHQVEMARELIEMQRYMAREIERVRDTPDDKLLSRLVNLETDGRHLEVGELQSLILQILVAGNETTTTTLANGMKTLIERPELVDQLYREPARARSSSKRSFVCPRRCRRYSGGRGPTSRSWGVHPGRLDGGGPVRCRQPGSPTVRRARNQST